MSFCMFIIYTFRLSDIARKLIILGLNFFFKSLKIIIVSLLLLLLLSLCSLVSALLLHCDVINMKRLNYDITRRSDAARRSSRRAEIRLAKKFNEAGGLEDEMRYHLMELKREQVQLRRELQGLKFESRRSSEESNKSHGVIHLAEPNLEFRSDDDENRGSSSAKNSGYGRNYFGYMSAPGSHKTHNRTAKDIEKSLNNYYYKVDNRMSEAKTKKKLKQQKKENVEVQEKLNAWKLKNPSRRKFSFSEPPNLKHLSFLRNEFLNEPDNHEAKASGRRETNLKPSTDTRRPSVEPKAPSRNDDVTLERVVTSQGENQPEKPDSANSSNKENTQITSSFMKNQTKENLFFDVDLYAPDGRLRMAHRMPEFQKAFIEARQARYVRSKDKREFERQLSTSEVFK